MNRSLVSKKDMSVSMSMSTYDEINEIIGRYYKLRNEILNCVDTSLYDNNLENHLRVHLDSIIPIIKSVLPYNYNDVGIVYDRGE